MDLYRHVLNCPRDSLGIAQWLSYAGSTKTNAGISNTCNPGADTDMEILVLAA
jgi:hypothetical protein